MTLKALYYFKKVAEVQHFGKAAKELYISQPTLSYTITELEKELGTDLFIRKNKKIVLNSYGELFLSSVEKTISTLEKGIEEIQAKLKESVLEIKIGYIQSLGNEIIPSLIEKFYQTSSVNPNLIKFIFIQKSSLELQELFLKKEIDILFNVEKSKIGKTFLFLEQELCFISSNKDFSSPELDLSSLKNKSFILINKGTKLREIIDFELEKLNFIPNIKFEMDNCGTIVNYVNKGMGISIVPITSINSDNIIILRNKNINMKRPIYVSFQENNYEYDILKNFKTFIFNNKENK